MADSGEGQTCDGYECSDQCETDDGCYTGNFNSDRGDPDSGADNPKLDVGDTGGNGPDNINISELEYGVEYVGGAYVNSMGGQVRQPATFRLSLGDDLVDKFMHEFTSASQFWTIFSLRISEEDGVDPTFIHDALDGYPTALPRCRTLHTSSSITRSSRPSTCATSFMTRMSSSRPIAECRSWSSSSTSAK